MLIRTLLLILALSAAVSCAGLTTTQIYADADEPHVILEYPEVSDLRADFYPARLMRIDGRTIWDTSRRQIRITPGEHEIGLEPSHRLIATYLPKHLDDKKVPTRFTEKTVTAIFEAGKTYVFGAEIEGENFSNWTPVVREKASN